MSYEIIPNWSYLGKPVYTNTGSDSVLDIPVAMPILETASPDAELSYPRFNRRGELETSYTDDADKFKKDDSNKICWSDRNLEKAPYNWLNTAQDTSLQLKTKTMYIKKNATPSTPCYVRLGKFVRSYKEPYTNIISYYYFSDEPDKRIKSDSEFYYDPREKNEPVVSDSTIGTSIPVARASIVRAYPNDSDFDIPARKKKIQMIPLEQSLHFKRIFTGYGKQLSNNEMEQLIKSKTMYREKYNQGYEKLGNYVRHVTTGDNRTIYYFSEQPERGYDKLELVYDPTESDDSSNKKAGKRKTKKNNKKNKRAKKTLQNKK